MRDRRAISVSQLESQRFKALPFDGEWFEMLGSPERTGSWIIWGESNHGKTRFALKLAKYMCRFGRVAYDSLEEGVSLSLKKAFSDINMSEVKRKLILLDKEPIPELIARLRKPKGPDVVIVDSIQYSGLNYAEYKALRDTFRNKLFIFISHADGKNPEGSTAKKVRFDAFVKIRVEGFKAFAASRYGGGEPYTIWEEGADLYWGQVNK